jgi:hypothetical protein
MDLRLCDVRPSVHLYALAVSCGKARANAFYAGTKLRLRFHWSPGLRTRKSYRREAPTREWEARSAGSTKTVSMSAAQLLRGAPFGSRVLWHNAKGERAWINESAVKVSANRYRGFPLFGRAVEGWKIQMGLAAHQIHKDRRDRLVVLLRDIRGASPGDVQRERKLQDVWQYVRRHVYLREVEIIGPNPRV